MSATRLEIDVKRLLSVCEEMAQNNSSDDWRLSKVDIFIYIIPKSLGFKFHILRAMREETRVPTETRSIPHIANVFDLL